MSEHDAVNHPQHYTDHPRSELDVDAIEARANAARSGPWKWHWDVFGDGSSSLDYLDGGGGFVLSAHGMHTDGWIDADDSDAEFIAHARTDIPALVARVRELEHQLEQANRFGIGEFRATEWAYKQACAALEKQRDRADSAEAKLRRLQP